MSTSLFLSYLEPSAQPCLIYLRGRRSRIASLPASGQMRLIHETKDEYGAVRLQLISGDGLLIHTKGELAGAAGESRGGWVENVRVTHPLSSRNSH